MWTFGSNARALMVAAFTSATTGSVVTGWLAKVYDDKKVVTDAVNEAKETGKQNAAAQIEPNTAAKIAAEGIQ